MTDEVQTNTNVELTINDLMVMRARGLARYTANFTPPTAELEG